MARGKTRPTFIITDEIIEEIKKLAAHSLTQDEIYEHFGISKTMWYTKVAKDPRIAAAIRSGFLATKKLVVGKLIEQIKAGKLAAIRFWLLCQGGWIQPSTMVATPPWQMSGRADDIPKDFGNDPNEAAKTYLKIMG